jgi:hypothetical protein
MSVDTNTLLSRILRELKTIRMILARNVPDEEAERIREVILGTGDD